MSNPAHAVGRRDPLRPRQVVHEERVRRQDRQGHQTGGRRMGRVVQVMNIVIVMACGTRKIFKKFVSGQQIQYIKYHLVGNGNTE